MIWKDYSHLSGSHSFLSPSRHHWLNYDNDKLIESYKNHRRVVLGTRYHELAENLIRLAVRLPKTEASLNAFVNDAIGYGMSPEVVLFYSPRCFGTADAISFEDGVLRIHDLKTGKSPASMNQLLIYAALFCLDYELKEKELREIQLRIYQDSEVTMFNPSSKEVFDVVFRIKEADRIIKSAETESL